MGAAAALVIGGSAAYGRQDAKPPEQKQPDKGLGAPGVPAAPAGAGQPAGQGSGGAKPQGGKGAEGVPPDVFRFSAMSEPTDLTELVNFVRDQLGIPIVSVDAAGLAGQKVFMPAAVDVPVDKMLQFLEFLLAQKQFALVRNELGIYIVQPTSTVTGAISDDPLSATQVIWTSGLRPSSLQQALAPVLVGQGLGAAPAYIDDLGVIIVTDTPRRTKLIRDLVERLVAERAQIKYQRFELEHVAASTARTRLLELLTGGGGGGGGGGAFKQGGQQGEAQVISAGPTASLANMGERLTVDAQGNALLFRGREDEAEYVQQLLALVDIPNSLVSKWYSVGISAAEAISQAGQREGLGGVSSYTPSDTGGGARGGGFGLPQQQQPAPQFPTQQQGQERMTGPGFVIYTESGGFMYHGTPAQHERVARLVSDLSDLTASELIVVEFYKLKHSKSTDVSQIIGSLLNNQVPSGTSRLIGGDLSRRGQPRPGDRRRGADRNQTPGGREGQTGAGADRAGGSSEGLAAISGGENTFVLADEPNNQVVVKAPKRLQPQFARLIERLDLRRPQVYIDAKIVAITANDDFRLAVETQLINAGGSGGAFKTNFGLATPGASDSITTPPIVPATLSGLTAALIRSDQVPIIINALASNTDTRIISTPQLLVDDNEHATVSSINEVPTLQTNISNSSTTTSTGASAEAGTTLNVTPQISEGGTVKMDLDIELSSFVGQASSPSLPPPSQRNNLTAQVTVPTDSTIVVGGLTFESRQGTVFKVPLIGDIPLLGNLFKDQRKSNQRTTLYVFLTPRIMRDPTFDDLRLLTQGPMQATKVRPLYDLPAREPVRMEIIGPGGVRGTEREGMPADDRRKGSAWSPPAHKEGQ